MPIVILTQIFGLSSATHMNQVQLLRIYFCTQARPKNTASIPPVMTLNFNILNPKNEKFILVASALKV